MIIANIGGPWIFLFWGDHRYIYIYKSLIYIEFRNIYICANVVKFDSWEHQIKARGTRVICRKQLLPSNHPLHRDGWSRPHNHLIALDNSHQLLNRLLKKRHKSTKAWAVNSLAWAQLALGEHKEGDEYKGGETRDERYEAELMLMRPLFWILNY